MKKKERNLGIHSKAGVTTRRQSGLTCHWSVTGRDSVGVAPGRMPHPGEPHRHLGGVRASPRSPREGHQRFHKTAYFLPQPGCSLLTSSEGPKPCFPLAFPKPWHPVGTFLLDVMALIIIIINYLGLFNICLPPGRCDALLSLLIHSWLGT